MQAQGDQLQRAVAPAIYYVPGFLAGPLSSWTRHFERARAMGFRQICTAPVSAARATRRTCSLLLTSTSPIRGWVLFASTPALIADLAASAAGFGLETLVDVVLDRVAVDGGDGRPS